MSRFDWRHFAQKDPRWWDPPVPAEFQRSQLAEIQSLLRGARPTCVLEIGVGRGRATPWLRDSWEYVGIEVNRSLLGLARTRGVGSGVVGTGTVLPFREGVFGAVVAYDVLMHVWDRDGFFDECRRVLASGGLFVANYLRRFSPGWKRYVLAWTIHPRLMLGSRDRRFDVTHRVESSVVARGFRTNVLMKDTSSPILVARKAAKSVVSSE